MIHTFLMDPTEQMIWFCYRSVMFEGHSTFDEPGPETLIWRYMDFTKFVSFIATRTLWFSKPSALGDQWELAYTRANRIKWIERHGGDENAFGESESARNRRANLQSMYVNCWHRGDVESAAMWRLYLSGQEGIAVQSTWRSLTGSIGVTRDPVHGGNIRYVDFESDDTDDQTNIFFPSTTKRLSFSYEQEVRLVTWWRPDRSRGLKDYEQIPEDLGIKVPVDVNQAVRRIVICPGSSDWFKDLVREVTGQYNFTFAIENSSMDTEPTHL